MKVDFRKIPKGKLLQGMNLALKNSRSLLKEAQLLAEHNFYSRACVLSVLSIEEAGKVVFLTMCFHKDKFDMSQKDMNKFWKFWSTHEAKAAFFEDYVATKWRTVLYVRKRRHDKEIEQYYEEIGDSLLMVK